MRSMRILLGLFLSLFLFLISNVSALTIDSCQTISSSDLYILNQSVTGNNTDCFTINANDVILDCNGYSLTNIGNISYGITIDGYNNITIKNCNLADNYQVYLSNSDDIKIYNVTITNSSEGIRFNNVSNTYIDNLTINETEREGIIFEDSNNLTIENSFFTNIGFVGNVSSLLISGDTYTEGDYRGVTLNNITISNVYDGISISNMDNILINASTIGDIVDDGVTISSGNDITISNSYFNDYGFSIGSYSGENVSNVNILNNYFKGYNYLVNVTDITIEGNTFNKTTSGDQIIHANGFLRNIIIRNNNFTGSCLYSAIFSIYSFLDDASIYDNFFNTPCPCITGGYDAESGDIEIYRNEFNMFNESHYYTLSNNHEFIFQFNRL